MIFSSLPTLKAFEEVGFDFSGQVEEENILEMVIRDQRVALFVGEHRDKDVHAYVYETMCAHLFIHVCSHVSYG